MPVSNLKRKQKKDMLATMIRWRNRWAVVPWLHPASMMIHQGGTWHPGQPVECWDLCDATCLRDTHDMAFGMRMVNSNSKDTTKSKQPRD